MAKVILEIFQSKLHPVVYEYYSAWISVVACRHKVEIDVHDTFGLIGIKPLILAFSEVDRTFARVKSQVN